MPIIPENRQRSGRGRSLLILLGLAAIAVVALGIAALLMPMESIALDAGEPLTQAVVSGNSTQVAALLKSGVNVDTRSLDGRTALILAAMLGDEATVKVLLANGADVTLRGNDGLTARQWARKRFQFGVDGLLKNAGATQ